jgi:hypothetical protein
MEIKDIVEKALKGEDYSADVEALEPEKVTEFSLELRKAASVASKEELDKVSALRKERARIENPPVKPEDSQLRTENVQLAKEKFFADPKFKLTDEERTKFESEFKKLDSGKIAPELIIQDLRKAYVAINTDKLLDSQERVSEFEKNAAEFNANMAGGSTGDGSPDISKYSQAAQTLHKSWLKQGIKGKTLDDAQKLIDRGEDWRGRELSA